jgi:hypothetical protein
MSTERVMELNFTSYLAIYGTFGPTILLLLVSRRILSPISPMLQVTLHIYPFELLQACLSWKEAIREL